MHPLIEASRPQIAALCQRFGVARLDVFGSALRGDFDTVDSDLDATVEFAPQGLSSELSRYFELKQALEVLLQRPVDLVELRAMPESRLKRLIARSRVPLYAAAA